MSAKDEKENISPNSLSYILEEIDKILIGAKNPKHSKS